jgi:integrase/recombinase XerD
MRTPSGKAKSSKILESLIAETAKPWRRRHLTYDQARYVAKEVRSSLKIERTKTRKRVVERLSREEEKRLIQVLYRDNSELGLLIKTLFQTGARVSEFINSCAIRSQRPCLSSEC